MDLCMYVYLIIICMYINWLGVCNPALLAFGWTAIILRQWTSTDYNAVTGGADWYPTLLSPQMGSLALCPLV